MSDIENYRAKPDTTGLSDKQIVVIDEAGHDLDGEKQTALFLRLKAWYDDEDQRQAENRYQMSLDEDFYDDLQWDVEEAQILMERGQAPLVFNKIKPAVNWVLGTETRTRIDYKVLPRSEDDEKGAEVKDKILKYISDVNSLPFERSCAFADAAKVGLGWLEDGITDDPTMELLFSRRVNWRCMRYDSNSTDLGLKDARYIFRDKWLDLDFAVETYKDREDVIRSSARHGDTEQDADDYYLGQRVNSQTANSFSRHGSASTRNVNLDGRERVKVIECWYRTPKRVEIMRGQFAGKEYDEKNAEMAAALESGEAKKHWHVKMEVRCAIFTESGLLWEGETPYAHNRFPFTPIWYYRRGHDNAPYGMIRGMRDPQEDYNKRSSKALFLLSVNRVVTEDGAVEDHEVAREEAAKPDSYIVLKKGDKKFEISQDKGLANEHLMLMDRDARHIQDSSGVTDENMGRESNATSGKAILARQEQGTVTTALLFDHYGYAIQKQGELQVSLIEQFYTEEKVVRIVGDRKPIEWLQINKVDPATGRILNDITARQADFVVSKQDFRDSMRQAASEQLMLMLTQIGAVNPQAAIGLLDMVVDLWDLPNKEEWLSRIRKINGQSDPSRKPTPEEEQQMQAAQAEEAAIKEFQMAQGKAGLDATLAQTDRVRAETDKTKAGAMEIRSKAMYSATQTAQVVAAMPAVAQIADVIMQGAGYEDKEGQDPNLPMPDQAIQQPMVAMPGPNVGMEQGIETLQNDGAMTNG